MNFAKSTEYSEREALYNIKVEVLSNPDITFQTDSRIPYTRCDSNVVNFGGSVKYEYKQDDTAPYQMEIKNLINQFGVSGRDSKDEFELYIYSDYLRQSVRIPDFSVKDDELIQFTNIFIPCGSEVLVSMVKKETDDLIRVHNTQRVACNTAAVGYARKEFRFHNMELGQESDPKAFAKAQELVSSA